VSRRVNTPAETRRKAEPWLSVQESGRIRLMTVLADFHPHTLSVTERRVMARTMSRTIDRALRITHGRVAQSPLRPTVDSTRCWT
jgi:hypothetical protein